MKGFIAAVLAWCLASLRRRCARPIHIALSQDEEVGCLGAPRLIEALLSEVPRPAMVDRWRAHRDAAG